jgi:dimethylaniline monooxygenase (N-oxide forming)
MSRKVAIIGAGAGGLCAAKHLKQAGMDVTIYEMGSCIGGLWVYENDNGLSPAYKSLHVNSEAKVTAYKDFPFPDDSPLYPDHRQMVSYLEDYSKSFGLVELIRFRSKVNSVKSLIDQWQVEIDGHKPEIFDLVVVASGHQSEPRHPPFASDFTGEYLHAHSYREPEGFAGKDVLVVGVGNSACDIASDICTHTKSVTLAARSPVLLMPRMFLGVPTSRVLAKLEKPWMPWPLRRFIRTTIARMAHGTMEQWGFVTPKTRTHPAGHHLLIGHFIWGRITAKPGIKSIDSTNVEFVDGSHQKFDTMIAATGYEVRTPFLDEQFSPMDGDWPDLYLRIAKPGVQNLFYIGFFNVSGGGNIRMMDDQAKHIAALATGKYSLPDKENMLKSIEAEREHIRQHYPDSPRYGLELDPIEYRAQLAKAIK